MYRIIMWMNFPQRLYDLHIKQTLVFHFFQPLAKFLNMLSEWKMMTIPLSNMANTETNACYKIFRTGYCLLIVTQKTVFSRNILPNFLFSKDKSLYLRHSLQNETGLHACIRSSYYYFCEKPITCMHMRCTVTQLAQSWKCLTLPPLVVRTWGNSSYHTVI